MPLSRLSVAGSRSRACRAALWGLYTSAEGGNGVSIIPSSGFVFAAGCVAGAAGAGAGAAAAGGGVTGAAGACWVVLIASLAGGTETPSYGLGLACAKRNGVLRAKLRTGAAAAAKEKCVFVIAVLT